MSDAFDHAGDAYYSNLERYEDSRVNDMLDDGSDEEPVTTRGKLMEVEFYNNHNIPVEVEDLKNMRPPFRPLCNEESTNESARPKG